MNCFFDALNRYLDSVSIEDKKLFADQLFSTLESYGFTCCKDIFSGGIPAFANLLKSLISLDSRAQSLGYGLLSAFINNYLEDIKKNLTFSKEKFNFNFPKLMK